MPRPTSMHYGNESGIYAIRNCIDQRIYIGSAIQFRKRRDKHFNELKKNKHHSNKLQRFVNKYGIESITFHILEFVSSNKLYEVEQQYLDNYQPFFNTSLNAISFRLGKKNTEEHRRKISIAQTGKVLSIEHRNNIMITHHSRKDGRSSEIIQLTRLGAFVKEWPCLTNIIEVLSFNREGISNNLNNRSMSSSGYIWIYKSKYNVAL